MRVSLSMNKKSKTLIPYLLISIIIIISLLVVFLFYTRKKNGDTPNDSDTVTIHQLKVCHKENPLGIDDEIPTFSWQMASQKRGAMQTAYRIRVAESKEALSEENYLWDSGKVSSSESVGICYDGPSLKPKTRYFWSVTAFNESDTPFSSDIAWFETGLLGTGLEGAKWISAPAPAPISYVPDDFSYNIHYDLELENTSAGFVFGACEGRYGDLYICEITHREENTYLCLQQMKGGAYASEAEVDITMLRPQTGNSFSVDLLVDSSLLTVSVNNMIAGVFPIEESPVGSIGYYKSRGTSYAYFDNINVTGKNGNLLFFEDFEDEETIFSPYHITLADGRLKAGSGMILTKGYESPAPLFRREFAVQDKEIASARLYATALGSFSASINGMDVSDDYLSPGKIAFNKQLSYVTYDVTDKISKGQTNALGLILLHGWYDRAVGYPKIWNPWGAKNALLCQLEIRYQDGTSDVISTDSSFLCYTDGPIREDDIYQGEYYDASYEQTGYDTPGFDASSWMPSEENNIDPLYLSIPLTAKANEPIRCLEELKPVSVTEPADNVFVYDFGRNFAGTCRFTLKGEKGQVITLRYGEELNTESLSNKDDVPGTIWTENLLTANATDYYVMSGDPGGETFEPEFVYHGFRYLQITGIEEAIPTEDIVGVALSSDLERTGTFNSSNELLNQFYQNTENSRQSNFMDNPTDCPQRDERHGWAGDAQIFSLTASYHADTYLFYQKYLEELRLLQSEGGSFSDMAPRNFGTNPDGTGGAASTNCWGDAPVVITWNLYTQYGDKEILRENYDALCKWVDVLELTSDNYIRIFHGYGDHLSLEDTPADLSDTAWCAYSAHLLSQMALALDKPEDAKHYEAVYNNFKEAWQKQYVLPDGMTICNTQTSYVLGLAFSLFPEELTDAALNHLLLLFEYSNYEIKTGFSGIGHLFSVLSKYDRRDIAYRLLLKEGNPALLYPVTQGATTTWELWDGHIDNGDGTYTLSGSFNHYTYGSPASFLYTDILGITSDASAPGYKHILLEPHPSNQLPFASGSYKSAYGTIYSSYEITDAGITYTFEIPANTSATLTLPKPPEGTSYQVDGKPVTQVTEITPSETSDGKISYELPSGSYCFSQGAM